MSISSTGIYGSSYLYEDVEELKTNLTTLTTSHLSTATNHDGRLDILETDNTSNKERLSGLEDDNTSNKGRLIRMYVCMYVYIYIYIYSRYHQGSASCVLFDRSLSY
jgi:hypothetical protein